MTRCEARKRCEVELQIAWRAGGRDAEIDELRSGFLYRNVSSSSATNYTTPKRSILCVFLKENTHFSPISSKIFGRRLGAMSNQHLCAFTAMAIGSDRLASAARPSCKHVVRMRCQCTLTTACETQSKHSAIMHVLSACVPDDSEQHLDRFPTLSVVCGGFGNIPYACHGKTRCAQSHVTRCSAQSKLTKEQQPAMERKSANPDELRNT